MFDKGGKESNYSNTKFQDGQILEYFKKMPKTNQNQKHERFTFVFKKLFLVLTSFVAMLFALKTFGESLYGWILNRFSQEIEGMGWGDVYLGFFSSNCKNENECETSDYKLQTSFSPPPLVYNTSFEWHYCDYDKAPLLLWEVYGTQRYIQIQILRKEDSAVVYDSGEREWSYSYFPKRVIYWQMENLNLEHGKEYHWRIRVADENKIWSSWAEGGVFQVPQFKFPKTEFEWWPKKPSVDEVVEFYNLTFRNTGYSETEEVEFEWKVPALETQEAECIAYESCDCQSLKCLAIKLRFLKTGPKSVKLEATHLGLKDLGIEDTLSGLGCGPGCCQSTKEISVAYPLPQWKESVPR